MSEVASAVRVSVGRLVLVPTPIGNLGDISSRMIEVLTSADVIACEDTRHTRKLLSSQNITGKRLLAVHEHNEQAAADGLVKLAEQGQVVALVTDAGTPAISDPGSVVVRAFVDAGFAVECLPGPAAFVVALAISGLATQRFVFEGFLPAKGSGRAKLLEQFALEERTVVLYEAPHRMLRLMEDLAAACGRDRRVSISRELTKRFETTIRLTLGEAISALSDEEPRGEYVVVLSGASGIDAVEHDDESIRARINELTAGGMRTRDAVDAVSAELNVVRRRVYAIAIEH
jgi:16S rRNA (cytidine1402-2'-O)-methyltransferase